MIHFSKKEPKQTRPIHKILLWLSLCLLAVYGILRLLYVTQGISLWILGGTAEDINHLLHFSGVLCLLIGSGLLLIRRCRNFRALITLLLIVLLLCALFLHSFVMLFTKIPVQRTVLTSPNGAHHLVVREQGALFTTTASVYEEIAPGFLKKIGSFRSRDYLYPLANGECEILWQEDGVTIRSQWITHEGNRIFVSYADSHASTRRPTQ